MVYTCLKCQGESPLNYYQYILLKTEGQEGKTVPFWGGYQWEGHKEKVNEGKCGGNERFNFDGLLLMILGARKRT
jgi:hypothetical protein